MIYIYYGEDFNKVVDKAHSLLTKLLEKKENATTLYIDMDTFSKEKWEKTIETQGLFVEKLLVFGSKLFENEKHINYIQDNIEIISKSNNIFILADKKIPTILLKKLNKYAEKIVKISQKNIINKKKQNPFSITSLLGQKDKKKLFVEYEKALLLGQSPDDIYLPLFWQIKTILSVKIQEMFNKNLSNIGIKPYPIQKARNFAKNFKVEELKNISQKFTKGFHTARFGGSDLDLEIIGIILSL